MKKVITYGTFDLFHEGHYNLLKRAKNLGDYLIVGVTTNQYDEYRGKLNVVDPIMKRIENVKNTGLVDEIVIEDHPGQKLEDIQKYNVDIFTVGSDWTGKFDFLKEYCKVVYLERTKGISSTLKRQSNYKLVRIGIIGSGRIAHRFVPEAKYVSGAIVDAVYNQNLDSAKNLCEKFELKCYTDNLDTLFKQVDAVYIASPHITHYDYIKKSLLNGKHVLCEKPLVLEKKQAIELYNLANEKNIVLMEAIKTAYCPGFNKLLGVAKNGCIGEIKDIEAGFTKLISGDTRELKYNEKGGSFTELATYPLLPVLKLLGTEYKNISFTTFLNKDGVDLYTKGYLEYENAISTVKIGLGVKSEGHMLISGTKGYIYVEAPWWKTESFEIRYENQNNNEKFFYKFLDDGLRYELSDFISLINGHKEKSYKFTDKESIKIAEIMEIFLNKENTRIISRG